MIKALNRMMLESEQSTLAFKAEMLSAPLSRPVKLEGFGEPGGWF